MTEKKDYMKKNRAIDEEAIKQDCYYTTGENGHGLYAIPINIDEIYRLPEDELKVLRKKHQTIGIELEKKYRTLSSYSASLDVLNNSTTLDLINEALNRQYHKDFGNKTFYGVSGVSEE